MSTEGMPDTVALLFGIGIIIVFSYERFNRISYETGRRLERLVTFLTPDKLRGRRQVTYAYFIYTLVIVVLYVILCAYAKVLLPLIGGGSLVTEIGASGLPDATSVAAAAPAPATVSTGFAPMGKPAAEFWTEGLKPSAVVVTQPDNDGINIDPNVSMGLALIMVGLAPSIPALARADEWLRMVAHRMAGIPTWAIEASDALRSNATELQIFPREQHDEEQKTGKFLIAASEFERVRTLSDKASTQLGNSQDFLLNIEVILVASAWFIDEKLQVTGNGDKLRFKDIEEDLRRRKIELIRTTEAENLSREEWEALAADADALASDFCVLIALYDEQDIIQPYGNRPAATADQRRTRERLKSFVDVLYKNKTEPMMHRRGTNLALFWSLAIVMIWTVLWAILWPGAAEFNLSLGRDDSNAYLRLRLYSMTAFNTYCIAVIVAITLRWGRTMTVAEDGLRKWENMRYPSHWTRWVPQALLVLFSAWAISTALFVTVQMWQSGILQKDSFSWEELLLSIQRRFEYNAPMAFRAAVLALLVTILLDARQRLWMDAGRFKRIGDAGGHERSTQEENAKKWKNLSLRNSLHWAALGAGVMFVTTLVTRYLTFLASAQGRRPFDNIDAGLMIWATLYNTILVTLVMFCLSEVLTSRAIDRPSARTREATS